MIDTNALLSFGLAIVANFTNVVGVPPAEVPSTSADLRSYIVGSPNRPTDLYVVHRTGTCYWIFEGVVQGFESRGSYFQRNKLDDTDKYTGAALLDSNQVVLLATRTLEALARSGNPIANLTPTVRSAAGARDGSAIPFYLLTWPGRPNSACDQTAEVEIDARTGRLVRLMLWDNGFFDLRYGRQIRDMVYRADPKPKQQPLLLDRVRFPVPSAEQVRASIELWLDLCRKLGINPGSDETLERVDWDRTFVYTNGTKSEHGAVSQIHFKNGVHFEAVDRLAISHFSSDSCYIGAWDDRPMEEWQWFRGKVKYRWEDLASALEIKLVTKLGTSRATLSTLHRILTYDVPKSGATGTVRAVVRWTDPTEDRSLAGSGMEPFGALRAEFDLESGELKWIEFHNPVLLGLGPQSAVKAENKR